MFIIVYLGALMMLFVFVVMLFNVQQNRNTATCAKLFGFFFASIFANKLAQLLFQEPKFINLSSVHPANQDL
jgi:NADH:ubiquinone oxidoreductase subunit 6 (subunit J)